MSVGIMDQDVLTYTLVPFNLEAMKLSAYYKKNNQVVVFAPEFTPERHQIFIYRKDYDDGIFPINLNQPNVQYGGYAFSGENYVPLDLEIESMVPDTELYVKWEKIIKGVRSKERKKIYENMYTGEHCRLSLDGKTIWADYPKQFRFLKNSRNLLVHDFDLNRIDGACDELHKLMARARTDGWPTRLGMKFPVVVSDGQSLLNWSNFNSNSTFFSLRYNGVIDDDAFIDWVGHVRDKSIFSQIEYNVTAGDYDEEYFINHLLIKLYHQVIISRSFNVFFSLKFDEGFFTDKRWCHVLQLINYYHNALTCCPQSYYLSLINDHTLIEFCQHCPDEPPKWFRGNAYSKQQMREIFSFVREYNYPLFKDFYECSVRTLGGKI